jgi:hypothetical protein
MNMVNGSSALTHPMPASNPSNRPATSLPPTRPPPAMPQIMNPSPAMAQAQPDIIASPKKDSEDHSDKGLAEAGPQEPPTPSGASGAPFLAQPDVGSSRNSDFRPDMGHYNLVVVREKDIATRPKDVQDALKHSPSGKLPLNRESFYLTTHRLAEKAGVPAHARGSIIVKADALGKPLQPLASFAYNTMTEEKAEGQIDKQANAIIRTLAGSTTVLVIVVVILAVMLYKAYSKKYKKDAHELSRSERRRERRH